MLLLQAYFDESGHFADPELNFTGMAGFIAPANVWKIVSEKWTTLTSEYRMEEAFRMRHFSHNHGQFQGWEYSKKDSLYKRLIQILVDSEIVPTGCVVSNEAFRSLTPRQQAGLRSPYFTAMQECIRGACAQRSHLSRKPWIWRSRDKLSTELSRQEEQQTLITQG